MDTNPYIKFKNIYVIPTFHSRIEFAKLVRTAFFKVFPDLIAIELPSNVKEEILEAVERLPFLSLIGYADTLNPEKLNYIPIDPGDSIIESIRIGLEYNTPIEFIDLSVTEYLPSTVKLPDDYAINQIGLSEFHQKISEYFDKNYSKKK
ncbi:MAG TPA: conjugal transfer protein TraB, partial [archaeon]|nr:conjugal transfer protein TraB [archaeon]